MVNHVNLARLFLIGLGIVAIYTFMLEKSPEEVSLIPCVFHSVTDVPCPGCGMTRACIALSQANFVDAWYYHPFSFLIVILCIGVAFFPLQTRKIWSNYTPRTRTIVIIFGIVLCLSIWIMKIKGGFFHRGNLAPTWEVFGYVEMFH